MSINNENKQQVIQDITAFLLEEIPSPELLIIYGSFITNDFRPGSSDIDIGFLSAETISDVQRWNIQEKLASKLDCDIDLVDMQTCNDVLKIQIVHYGKIIYQRPSPKTEQFLDYAYINYIQLNEDRAEILEHYS